MLKTYTGAQRASTTAGVIKLVVGSDGEILLQHVYGVASARIKLYMHHPAGRLKFSPRFVIEL